MYAIIKMGENTAVTGETLEEVISQVVQWELNEHRELIIKVKGYYNSKYHSYSKEWEDEEVAKDVRKFIAGRLENWDLKLYRKIE